MGVYSCGNGQIFSASQIAAAIAVVASLFFVGLQLRQSDRTQRAGSLPFVLDGYRDGTFLPGIASGKVADIWARADVDHKCHRFFP